MRFGSVHSFFWVRSRIRGRNHFRGNNNNVVEPFRHHQACMQIQDVLLTEPVHRTAQEMYGARRFGLCMHGHRRKCYLASQSGTAHVTRRHPHPIRCRF